jgi:hypothetical protein
VKRSQFQNFIPGKLCIDFTPEPPVVKKETNGFIRIKNETFILPQLSTGIGYIEAIL